VEKLDFVPPLLVSSALEPHDLMEFIDHIIQKPFDVQHFLDLVYYLITRDEYTEPNFDNLYRNYDYDSNMINKALNVLNDEFLKYRKGIRQTIESGDQKRWEETLHRLISTVRQLELKDLENLLDKDVRKIGDGGQLLRIVDWYILCIRLEVRSQDASMPINSGD
jgi:hypothetical protein